MRLPAMFVCLSVCPLARLLKNACMDYSPDSGTGFTPEFSISARLLKNACMDLDEMLRVDRCRDMDELINF